MSIGRLHGTSIVAYQALHTRVWTVAHIFEPEESPAQRPDVIWL